MNMEPDIIIGGAPSRDVLPGSPLALVPPEGHAEDLPAAEPLDVPERVDEAPVAEEILAPVPVGGSPTVVLQADELDMLIEEAQKSVAEWAEDIELQRVELQRRETEHGKAVGHVQVLNMLKTMQTSGSPVVIGVAQV